MFRFLLLLHFAKFLASNQVNDDISAVTNIKLTPSLHKESTSVVLTWDEPITVNTNNSVTDLHYQIDYCQLNKPDTCVNGTKISKRTHVIGGLSPDLLYSYHIHVYGADGTQGPITVDYFRTSKKDTCPGDQFTCVNSNGCVLKDRVCDGIVNCADATDEGKEALCALPKETPTIVNATSVKPDGFTIFFKEVHASDRPTEYHFLVHHKASGFNKTYTVTSIPGSSNLPRAVMVSGLGSELVYTVKSRAVNRVGEGKWSEAISVTTLAGLPGTISKVEIIPRKYFESTSVKLSWSAAPPQTANGDGTLRYQVTYCKLNFLDTCQTLPLDRATFVELDNLEKTTYYQYDITVYNEKNQTGLKPYQNYFKTGRKNSCKLGHFRCSVSDQCVFSNRTCNGIQDCGDGSDERIDAGCSAPRYSPQSVRTFGTTGSSMVRLQWNSVPSSDRPYLYNILIQEVGESEAKERSVNVLSGPTAVLVLATIRDLLPNREYSAKVRAVNVVGSGLFSEPAVIFRTKRMDLPVLDLPQNATITPVLYQESTSVQLSWFRPVDLKGNDAKSVLYQVNYCSINKPCARFTEKSAHTSVVLKDLIPRHIYQFTVRVFNENDESDAERSAYTYVFKTPLKDTCLTGYFSCAQSKGCVIKSRLCDGIVNCPDRSDELEEAGCEFPTYIGAVKVVQELYNMVQVEFEPSRDPKQRIRGYELENLSTKETQFVRHSTFSYERVVKVTFVGLKAEMNYEFRVRAVNPTGTGLWSPPAKALTKVKPTPDPKMTKSSPSSSSSVTTGTGDRTSDVPPSSGNSSTQGLSSSEKAGVAVAIVLAVVLVIVTVVIITKDKAKSGKTEIRKEGVSNPSYVEGQF